jgi:hypothetical protein
MAKPRKRWLAVVAVMAVIAIVAVFFTATAIAGLSVPHWIYTRAPVEPPVSQSMLQEVYTVNDIYGYAPWIPSAAYGYRDIVTWKTEDPGKALITLLPLTKTAVYQQANLSMDFKWSGTGASFTGSFKYDDARMNVYASGQATRLIGQQVVWHYPPGKSAYPVAYAVFVGNYRSTPPAILKKFTTPGTLVARPGTFLLFVEQREPDYGQKPFFWISFYGGPYDAYENGGIIKGRGWIQFPLKPILLNAPVDK